jgi:hypothetical protein
MFEAYGPRSIALDASVAAAREHLLRFWPLVDLYAWRWRRDDAGRPRDRRPGPRPALVQYLAFAARRPRVLLAATAAFAATATIALGFASRRREVLRGLRREPRRAHPLPNL